MKVEKKITASKKTTVKDIAKRMGVSLSTVNKALTGKSGISEKRRQEILNAAKEMGYTVNHVAQMLSRTPIIIGVITPREWQQYFASMERGLKMGFDELKDQNVSSCFQYVADEDGIENAFVELSKQGIQTVIYCSAIKLTEKCLESIKQNRMHVILADDICNNVGEVGSVGIDAALSGNIAADFLRLATGAGAEVAIFIGSRSLKIHTEKADAFLKRAEEVGLVPVAECENADNADLAREEIKKVIKTHPTLKGIYIVTALCEPIVEFVKTLPKRSRPTIISTDFYDFISESLECGEISATIFQNQILVGRLSAKLAYECAVESNSYHQNKTEGIKRICVTPQLLLPSNARRFTFDYGNPYTVSIES